MYPRVTLQILESAQSRQGDQDKMFYQNLETVTGHKLVK